MRSVKLLPLLLLLSPWTGYAETFEAPVIGDTYVDRALPRAGHGLLPGVSVGYREGAERIGYLLFDLRGLPPGAKVQEATLALYLVSGEIPEPTPCHVHHLYSSFWNEQLVSWENQHCGTMFQNAYFCDLDPAAETMIRDAGSIWYIWDVTSMLARVVQHREKFQNFVALALRIPAPYLATHVVFASKEAYLAPILGIEYETAAGGGDGSGGGSPEEPPSSDDEALAGEDPDRRPASPALRSLLRTADFVHRDLSMPAPDGASVPVRHDGPRRWTFIRIVQSHSMQTFLAKGLIRGTPTPFWKAREIADWIVQHQAEQGYYRYEMGSPTGDRLDNLYTTVAVAERLLRAGVVLGVPDHEPSVLRAFDYHLDQTWTGSYFNDQVSNTNPKINFNAHAAAAFAYASLVLEEPRYAAISETILQWLARVQYEDGSWPLRMHDTSRQTDAYHVGTLRGVARAVYYLIYGGQIEKPPEAIDRMLSRAVEHLMERNFRPEIGMYFYNYHDPDGGRGLCLNMVQYAVVFEALAGIYGSDAYRKYADMQIKYVVDLSPGRQNEDGSWNAGDITEPGGQVSWLYTPYTSGLMVEMVEMGGMAAGVGLLGPRSIEVWEERSSGPAAIAAATESCEPGLAAAPNPFTERLRLEIALQDESPASLRVYDAGGRLVRSLLDEATPEAGSDLLDWDGTDDGGRPLPAGVYFLQLSSGDRSVEKTVVLAP